MRQKRRRQTNPIDVKSFFENLSKAQIASLAVAGATVGGGIIYLIVNKNSSTTPTPSSLVNSKTEQPIDSPINSGSLASNAGVGPTPGKTWVKQTSFPVTVQPGSSILISMADTGNSTTDSNNLVKSGFQVLSMTSGTQTIPDYWPVDDRAPGRERFDLLLPSSSSSVSLNLDSTTTNVYFYQ